MTVCVTSVLASSRSPLGNADRFGGRQGLAEQVVHITAGGLTFDFGIYREIHG